MVTKVEAAGIAAGSGIHALVTSTPNAAAALAGEDVGTWFSVNGARKPIRLLWLAHLASVQGTPGARRRRRPGRAGPPHLAAAGRHRRGARATSKPATPWRWCPPTTAGDRAAAWSTISAAELPQMLGRSTRNCGKALGADMTAKLFMLTIWCWSRPLAA